MTAFVNAIGENIRRIRQERQVSLAELASTSGVAKATLANLEKGRGNPTIETLWALALGLHVAFSDLLEQSDVVGPTVVRAGEGTPIESDVPALDLRMVDRIDGSGLTEIFELSIPRRGRHEGRPHAPGIVERIVVFSGRLLAGPVDEPVELGPGDFVRYPADRPHVYEALDGPCRGVLLVEYE
jgi:transcriptional regulator with XRE-family HTH domain